MATRTHPASEPGSTPQTASEPACGVSYCPVESPDDPGQTQHAAAEPRSVGLSENPSPKASPAAGGASPPTSLDPSETNQHALPDQSRPQIAIHARHAAARFAIWSAFRNDDSDELDRRARKLALCCSMPALRATESGEIIVCPQRCRDRCCPLCSCRRAKTTGDRATEACRRMNVARLLTVTVPHIDAPLADQIASIRDAFARLRRSASWKAHVRGGVYGFEVKLSARDGRWHPHLHVIAEGEYYPHAALREDWRAALNHPRSLWAPAPDDPLATDVQLIRDRRAASEYVAKYIAKPAELSSWPPAAICEFAEAMRGVRLLSTFGSLHGVPLDATDPNADPGKTTHIAGITVLNTAARRGQRSAHVALLLFRLAFPQHAAWTRRDLDQLPDDALRDGESIPNALARVAASAEREFYNSFHCMTQHPEAPHRRKPPPAATLNLPF